MPRVTSTVKAVLMFVLLLLGAPFAPAQEDDTVERFLTRLGLTDLQALHLEQVLDKMPAGDGRKRTAERLADLYAGQLVESSQDKSDYDAVMQRIKQLVERVPEAKTASLEVMLLQADYFRAETLMSKWSADRSAGAARQEAMEILSRIAPQLDLRQQQLHASLESLVNEIDMLREGDELAVKTKDLNRLESVAGRASFFAAWSNYYLALATQPPAPSHPGFIKARDIFRRILGIEGSYGEVEPDGLGLESIWRSRTLIGLGMAEAASGNAGGSQACFELLARGPTPGEVRELVSYWRLQSLLNPGLLAEALPFAREYIAGFNGPASQGQVSFCVSLVHAGFGVTPSDPRGRDLAKLGVTGLIKLRQLAALRQLIKQYQIPLDGETGFYLRWFHGQQQLEAAQASQQDEDYVAASQSLTAALAAPDASTDLAAAAQCRYQLAWCQYRLEQFEAAAKSYEQARDGLKTTDPRTAAEAAWSAFVCYQTLAKTQRQYAAAAINVLAGIKRDFPEHPYAQRTDFHIGKLQQAALPPAKMIDKLEKIPAGSPDYLASRFEICQLAYDQWNQAAVKDKAAWATKLNAAVDLFLAAAQRDGDDSRKLRACLYSATAALSREPPDSAAAERYLDAARRWTGTGANTGVLAEYHYRSLQLATHRRDEAARRGHAEWIVKNAPGSPFEIPALVMVATSLDERLLNDAGASPKSLEEGHRVYERLVARFGSAPETLKSTKNAQVAASRLADYAYRLGRFAEASQLLATLLAAFPTDQGYLRRAGLSDFHANQHAQAIDRWRILVAGLPKESDAWFEAKYYQLACLVRLDAVKAREALGQFELLFPQLGPPAWRGRFAELQQKAERATPANP